MSPKKQISLHLPVELWENLRKIAEKEERTVQGQIIYWLKAHVREYAGV